MSRFLHTLLLLALLTPATCSEGPSDEAKPKPVQPPAATKPQLEPRTADDPPPEKLPLPEWFERSLAAAPRITRVAVLSTCESWRRVDGSCEAVAARRNQIRCWRQRGEGALKHAQNLGMKRRRVIDHKIMLLQNLCMETLGWQRTRPDAGV